MEGQTDVLTMDGESRLHPGYSFVLSEERIKIDNTSIARVHKHFSGRFVPL